MASALHMIILIQNTEVNFLNTNTFSSMFNQRNEEHFVEKQGETQQQVDWLY